MEILFCFIPAILLTFMVIVLLRQPEGLVDLIRLYKAMDIAARLELMEYARQRGKP